MTTESKELAFMPPRETAMQVFTTKDALSPYLAHVRAEIDAFKPDLTTKKGRDAIASMAYKVSQSKSALETLGKALADEAKEIPKKIDASRKAMKDTLDLWRDEVRKPLDDWEAEQQAIEAKRLADEAAAALLIEIENAHEIALILYADHCRKQEEAAKAAEQARIDNEARIAREAAELATKQANDAAAKLILDAQLEKQRAENQKLQAEAREKQAKIDSDARELKIIQDAEAATKLAADKAERDRVQAIEDERAKVAAENKRVADIKAKQDAEIAKAAANKNHQKKINNEAVDDLVAVGCTKELATAIVIALVKKTVRNVTINYH